MNDFYFVFFPVGYQFIKTMTSTFRFLPKDANVVVMTPTPELLDDVKVDFNLVVLNTDDLINDFSKTYEILIKEPDHDAYIKQLKQNLVNNVRFPYAVPRFIIPWMLEHNITKFAILDSDCIINYRGNLEHFFAHMSEEYEGKNCVFGPKMIQNLDFNAVRLMFTDALVNNNIDPNILNEIENPVTLFDGWMRGFWFQNKEYLQLYFNLWNEVIEKSYRDRYIDTVHNVWTIPDEWILGCINTILNKKYDVLVEDIVYGGRRLVEHAYHPENDYFFLHHDFLYKEMYKLQVANSRKEFLDINKEQLIHFYGAQNAIPKEHIKYFIYDYTD